MLSISYNNDRMTFLCKKVCASSNLHELMMGS